MSDKKENHFDSQKKINFHVPTDLKTLQDEMERGSFELTTGSHTQKNS